VAGAVVDLKQMQVLEHGIDGISYHDLVISTSKEMMQEQAGLSIAERICHLKNKYDVSMLEHTLRWCFLFWILKLKTGVKILVKISS
jgi:hypothetical protein